MKNQTFGVEVEFNGITRAKAAQIIADYFGTQVRYRGGTYDAREVRDQQGRVWQVVSDTSIAGPNDERCELVTPICRRDDIPVLQELIRKLRAAGAKAHESCGIHVHIGRGEHAARTLRNLVNMVNAKEDLLTQERRDRWCKPVEQRFLEQLNWRKPKDDDALARLWYDVRTDREAEHRKSYHYDESRYRLLNLHSTFTKGTIEFRAFNSTLHAGKIKAYIQLCMAISYAALTATSASPRRPITRQPEVRLPLLDAQAGLRYGISNPSAMLRFDRRPIESMYSARC